VFEDGKLVRLLVSWEYAFHVRWVDADDVVLTRYRGEAVAKVDDAAIMALSDCEVDA